MSVGRTGLSDSNQDDPKMSDPSDSSTPSSLSPVTSSDDEPITSRRSLPVALLLDLIKLAAMGLVIYLTYYFTMTFAQRTPPPAPLSEEQKALAKKAEDLRIEGKKVLTSYGWVNPAIKSNVRIPIDRAMELLVTEAARPPAAAVAVMPVPAAASTAPAAGTTSPAPTSASAGGTTGPAKPPATAVAVAAPPPPAARSGMPPDQIYRLVCMACHAPDGKGELVRQAMPSIPDLTDPKWQASRTDAELEHSILEGKESLINGVKIPLMLPMKDKLGLAHTDVKDMVAFMRAFKAGKQVVAPGPGGIPAPGVPVQIAQGPAPAPPSATAPAVAAIPSPPSTPSPPSAPTTATTLTSGPTPPQAPTSSPAIVATPGPAPAPTPATVLTQPAASTALAPALPPAIPAAAVNTAERAAKLRAAGVNFTTLCIACHGPDGRGTVIRAAMPTLPDFTTRDFQTSHSSTQLLTSILEGKGQFMVPWNTKLTQDQARDLVLYVRNFGPADLVAAETQPASGPSTAEFDRQLLTLRQKFDELEKQLHALPGAAPAR
jgi:mono/diheme cytochrome c family protein